MNATPISSSGRTPSDDSPRDNAVVTSSFDLLYRLVSQSPSWVRVVVVLILSALTVLYGLHYLGIYPPTPRPAPPQSYSLEMGKQVDGPGNKAMADPTEHLQQDDAHSRWHEEHPEDSPEMKKVFQIADDNYLGYKFYANSDRCVFVIRRENGVTTSRWLRDPISQSAAAGAGHHAEAGDHASQSADASVLARVFDGLIPSAEAAAPLTSPARAGVLLQSVQAGCVQGTHPGQFTWWWGPPENQCWTPMFRQWKDGCKHYQRFNKCSNAWDDTIHWVSCTAGPHS
jgi:hypothetical protein